MFDLLLRNARLAGLDDPQQIAIHAGRIAAIAPDFAPDFSYEAAETFDADGGLVFGGFVESHIHLDKACILPRCRICEGTLPEAIAETARAKAGFTEDDVYARAARVVEKAISHGTTFMRTFAEVDPRVGLCSLEALKQIRKDFAYAVTIEICAFAQEGTTQELETLYLLEEALDDGADLIGGAPYTDPDPVGQIHQIFELARRFDVPVDFHLDFDLDPGHTSLPAVIDETLRCGWQGRVALGHMTNLSAMPPSQVEQIARLLREAGIGVTALPATDLFLNGRGLNRLVPRGVAPVHLLAREGVATAIASNNILNPFTPYGDASLIRMANLYANLAQLSLDEDMETVFSMVSRGASSLVGRTSELRVGAVADLVLLASGTEADAVREVSRVRCGWKQGRRSFDNGVPRILRP